MPLELRCKACGQAFTPSKAEITMGPAIYRYCPACRPTPTGEQLERPPIAARR